MNQAIDYESSLETLLRKPIHRARCSSCWSSNTEHFNSEYFSIFLVRFTRSSYRRYIKFPDKIPIKRERITI